MIPSAFPQASQRRAQRGFVLAYALSALFALAMVAGLMARMQSARDAGAQMAESRDQLIAQASLIRSKLLSCAAMYPTSSAAIPFNAFPADADSDVKDLLCPGAPAGANGLWLADDALSAPTSPRGFSGWRYTRDASHVIRLSISVTSGVTAHKSALSNAAIRLGSSASIDGAGVLSIRMN